MAADLMELYAQFACAMPRDPRLIAAGPMARLVYYEAVMYCRENLTDGVIDRLGLGFWSPDIRPATRSKHLDMLVACGALEPDPSGWRIPWRVWAKWNPSRLEVETKRSAEAERLRNYRERKKAERDAAGERTTVRTPYVRDAYATPKPEPKPEPKKEKQESTQDRYDGSDEGAVIHRFEERLRMGEGG